MTVAYILSLIGLILDAIGVFMMANALFSSIHPSAFFNILMSALYKGATAKGATEFNLGSENILTSLQGMSFILIGFILQQVGIVIQILSVEA